MSLEQITSQMKEGASHAENGSPQALLLQLLDVWQTEAGFPQIALEELAQYEDGMEPQQIAWVEAWVGLWNATVDLPRAAFASGHVEPRT
jgi:hypothetical protein